MPRPKHARRRSTSHRALALVLAFLFGAQAGSAAHVAGAEVVPGAGLGRAAGAAATFDVAAYGAAAAQLLESIEGALPTPERPPADARAPTPEVRLGTLEIPSIGLSQPLHQGITLTAIDRGPSHWPGSALPGELGNMVIAGHRVTKTRPFYHLDEVQPGDEMIITTDEGRFVYVNVGTEIVTPDMVDHVVGQTYEYRATTFACHPRGSARQRIVARWELQDRATSGASAATGG